MQYLCSKCGQADSNEYSMQAHERDCVQQRRAMDSDEAFTKLEEARKNTRIYLRGIKALATLLGIWITLVIGGVFVEIISPMGEGLIWVGAVLSVITIIAGLGWSFREFEGTSSFEKVNKAEQEYNHLQNLEHQTAISRAEATKGKQIEK